MSQVIDLEKNRLLLAVKKGFRNWTRHFSETFGLETRIPQLSLKTLSFLAQGKDKGTFYLYDLIMNLKGFGSGFEFNELSPTKKMAVIDQYLFLLDQLRFECMKKMGLIEYYPGEKHTLVEMIVHFERLAPRLQAELPMLRADNPNYEEYIKMNIHDKEVFIRKLIPKVLEEFGDEPPTA